jgi:NAD-dependent deacetylase
LNLKFKLEGMMQAQISKAAKDLHQAKNVVALTGAGISIESGIPPFRGKGGLWEKYDPMEIAHIDAFISNPAKVWSLLIKDMKSVLDQARPNDGHLGLARLEKMGILKTVITQNVDGLHQMAGNNDVVEFHGNFAWQICMDCNKKLATAQVNLDEIPPRCDCGGIYKPDCIFFGEMIPPDHLMRSRVVSTQCEVMLVVGTSAVVQPAAYMPVIAKESGAIVIEINPEPTPLTGGISDYLIAGKAGEVMNRLVDEIESLL